MFTSDPFVNPALADATCSVCGKPHRKEGGAPPPEIAPFVRGEMYVEINPISFCSECGRAFCSACTTGMNCPECNGFLTAEPITKTEENETPKQKRGWFRRLFSRE